MSLENVLSVYCLVKQKVVKNKPELKSHSPYRPEVLLHKISHSIIWRVVLHPLKLLGPMRNLKSLSVGNLK